MAEEAVALCLLFFLFVIENGNSFLLESGTTKTTTAGTKFRYSRSRLVVLDVSTTVTEASAMMKDVREQLNENEDARLVLDALRGKNLNDDDAAVEGLRMRLVDVNDGVDANAGVNDKLPYEYDPVALSDFFKKRPKSVLTRIFQLASVGGGLAAKLALDAATGRTKKDPDLEIKRAGEIRDTITSLGPFYIKIGQALSIRPDILSPRSMVELQKLCDKVPSYDSGVAFATIERELGKPVNELFEEITPEPVAAASLGQVYKAKLKKKNERRRRRSRRESAETGRARNGVARFVFSERIRIVR